MVRWQLPDTLEFVRAGTISAHHRPVAREDGQLELIKTIFGPRIVAIIPRAHVFVCWSSMPTKFQGTQRPASRQAGGRPSLAEAGAPTHLRLRLNLHVRWIWELVDADKHVINVSAQDFSTRRECEHDARRHGFRLEVKSAANLTKLRQKAGLSQSEFWERVGITQSGGSRYEKGQLVRKPLRMLLTMAYGSAKERERVVQQLAKSVPAPDKENR